MHLLNDTAVAARIHVADTVEADRRAVLAIAKATYRVSASGRVQLDDQDPFPVMCEDTPTRYGVMPREDIPRLDDRFEIMVMGAAVAPGEQAIEQMEVALGVGTHRWRIRVTGDRCWTGDDATPVIGSTTPFVRMPLTWDRAFGGNPRVDIDQGASIRQPFTLNTAGKGYHAGPRLDDIRRLFGCPAPWPVLPETVWLPNLEDPAAPIRSVEDHPVPVCWAPCAIESGMLLRRLRGAAGDADPASASAPSSVSIESPLMLHRAHPDLVIDVPTAATPVTLTGMTTSGHWPFTLPRAGVALEVQDGFRTQAIDLQPRALMLFPSLSKFSLVYRGVTDYRYDTGRQRSCRVRLSQHWPEPGAGVVRASTGALS